MRMAKILIIDDEPMIRSFLKPFLPHLRVSRSGASSIQSNNSR